MDKRSGHRDTAFTWAMGRLILQRIADGDTMKAITADPRMPAYCTVYRWMQVVPEFGDLVSEVRAALAKNRLAERDAWRRLRRRQRRRQTGGRRSTLTGERLDRMLDEIRAGAALSEVVAEPGAPSFKVVYTALRRCPGFRAVFVEACDWRADWLEFQAEQVSYEVFERGISLAEAKRGMRDIQGWRGRVTPKLYRTARARRSDGDEDDDI
ncbi:MAG: hypothetical protein AB1942_19270 [Pseudomonadota bacterium]